LANSAGQRATWWGLGALSPLLLATAGAMYLPVGKRLQTIIAGVSMLLGGLLITYFSQVAMLEGNTALLGGQMLALIFACLCLGLLFRTAALIAAVLLL